MKKFADGGTVKDQKSINKKKLKWAMDKGMGWQSIFAIDDIADPTRSGQMSIGKGNTSSNTTSNTTSNTASNTTSNTSGTTTKPRPASNSWPDIVSFYFPEGAGDYYKDGGLVRGGGSAQRGRGRGRIV